MSSDSKDHRTKAQLLEEIETLRRRLEEAEQTLEAIRQGDVDALVVAGPHGEQVFSITGAEHIYRVIVETMNEAGPDGGPGRDDPVLQPAVLRPDEDAHAGGDRPQGDGLRRPAPAAVLAGDAGGRPGRSRSSGA